MSFDNPSLICVSVSVPFLNAGDQSSPSCARFVLFLQYNQLLTVPSHCNSLESHYYLISLLHFMLDSGTTLTLIYSRGSLISSSNLKAKEH